MLENYTYEELKKIVDEAPEGWEEYSPATDNHLGGYYKNCRNCYYNTYQRWVEGFVYGAFNFYTEQDITDLLGRRESYRQNFEPIPKQDLISQVFEDNIEREAVIVDISKFVNYVKVEDGKVLVNVDKVDVEGIVKLFGGEGGS